MAPQLPQENSGIAPGYTCAGCAGFVPVGDAHMIAVTPTGRGVWLLAAHERCVERVKAVQQRYGRPIP